MPTTFPINATSLIPVKELLKDIRTKSIFADPDYLSNLKPDSKGPIDPNFSEDNKETVKSILALYRLDAVLGIMDKGVRIVYNVLNPRPYFSKLNLFSVDASTTHYSLFSSTTVINNSPKAEEKEESKKEDKKKEKKKEKRELTVAEILTIVVASAALIAGAAFSLPYNLRNLQDGIENIAANRGKTYEALARIGAALFFGYAGFLIVGKMLPYAGLFAAGLPTVLGLSGAVIFAAVGIKVAKKVSRWIEAAYTKDWEYNLRGTSSLSRRKIRAFKNSAEENRLPLYSEDLESLKVLDETVKGFIARIEANGDKTSADQKSITELRELKAAIKEGDLPRVNRLVYPVIVPRYLKACEKKQEVEAVILAKALEFTHNPRTNFNERFYGL